MPVRVVVGIVATIGLLALWLHLAFSDPANVGRAFGLPT